MPLKKRRQFLKKIITFKESYHKDWCGCPWRRQHRAGVLSAQLYRQAPASGPNLLFLFQTGCLKAKYRTWLTEFRHKNQVPSLSVECGAKKFLELIMGASPSIISSSWCRTKKDLRDSWDSLREEEANVTPKAPENNKEKKFQPQITSFFAKKK